MEMKLELIPVPVSDIDRAKEFYVSKLGFHGDIDTVGEGMRFVQLTPEGSACSIMLDKGVTDMQPGTVHGLQAVVKDVRTLREKLIKNGVDASEVETHIWGDIVTFADPDGNTWSLQQMPKDR